MKNTTNIVKILFLSLFSIASMMGQNPAFVYLSDMTGYSLEDSPQHLKDDLMEAADSLRAALPDTTMQNDFAVYDMGFYSHHAAMTGGVQKVMADAISDRITHSYYLLFGREMDREGRIKKVWVEVELPNINLNGCLNYYQGYVAGYVNYLLEKNKLNGNWVLTNYSQSQISILGNLTSYLDHLIDCCNFGGDLEDCINCTQPNFFLAKLHGDGFVGLPISNIRTAGTNHDSIPEIHDYANKRFLINDEVEVFVPESYEEHIVQFVDRGLSIKVFVTGNESICSSQWNDIEQIVHGNTYDIIFWHHIHQNLEDPENGWLFTQIYINGEPVNTPLQSYGLESSRAVPLALILRAVGSGLADFLIQSIVIYITDDTIEEGDWLTTMARVNYGSVAWSSLTGMIRVNTRTAMVGVAVGAGLAEVMYNYSVKPSYTIEEAGYDFARTFIAHIIGQAVGNAAANRLRSININQISERGLYKIYRLFTGNNPPSLSQKLQTIRQGWRLELEGVASHTARGTHFEDLLYIWIYKPLHFEQTWKFFKGIDYHGVVNGRNTGISLKTTIQTSESNLRSLLRNNVRDLQTAVDRGYIEYIPTPLTHTRRFSIDDTKLIIFVPEENISVVQPVIDKLKIELDPTSKIDWVLTTFESFIQAN